jgi:bifunctional non-homologous end joining protein LigD
MSRQLREFRRGLEQAKASRIEPCLPSPTRKPPNGLGWLHEIKHDGYRMMVYRDAAGVRVITRNGHDWTSRYPLIATAAKAIKAKDFLIDGEAVSCDDTGLAVFERIRHRRNDSHVFLYAFDLLALNGSDLRRKTIEDRKEALARLLRPQYTGIQMLDHLEFDDGQMIFDHACELGCEGIVSKRLGSKYVSGRSRDWLKIKNKNAPAVKREAEEDWNSRSVR